MGPMSNSGVIRRACFLAGLLLMVLIGVTVWAEYLITEAARIQARDIDLARANRAADESAAFVDENMPLADSYSGRNDLLRASLQHVEPSMNGLYCEFGVASGATINFIASLVSREVHGFDSFEGLPEDWRAGFLRGAFARSEMPKVAANVTLHKGWFDETLPEFVTQYPQPLAFAHLDADLYSSTKTVLDILGPKIVVGTVLQFDEFFNYPGWKQGEYKAFDAFCAERNVGVEYIGYTGNREQVAVKIIEIDPLPALP